MAANAHVRALSMCFAPGSKQCHQPLELVARCVGEEALRELDSSVKRNTALIKRLRLINEDTRQSLLEDISRTKQTKVQ